MTPSFSAKTRVLNILIRNSDSFLQFLALTTTLQQNRTQPPSDSRWQRGFRKGKQGGRPWDMSIPNLLQQQSGRWNNSVSFFNHYYSNIMLRGFNVDIHARCEQNGRVLQVVRAEPQDTRVESSRHTCFLRLLSIKNKRYDGKTNCRRFITANQFQHSDIQRGTMRAAANKLFFQSLYSWNMFCIETLTMYAQSQSTNKQTK